MFLPKIIFISPVSINLIPFSVFPFTENQIVIFKNIVHLSIRLFKEVVFKNTRQNIGNSLLRRKLRNQRRKKFISNFENSQLIGVVFKTDNQSDFEIVKKFLHFLTEQNNKIVAMCYVDVKKVPDYYLLRKGFNFFSRNDLNFFFLPKSNSILDFIEKPFDMLIDLSTDNNFPLHFISNLSKAKFKIGKFNANSSCFDVMIDISKDNSVQSLIEHIKHYVPVLCGAN